MSITDTFEEKGVLGGLGEIGKSMVPSFLGGPTAQDTFAGGDVGSLLSGMGTAMREAASLMPGLGDLEAVYTGFKEDLDPWDRAFILGAGILGTGATGAAGLKGYQRFRAGQPVLPPVNDRGAVGPHSLITGERAVVPLPAPEGRVGAFTGAPDPDSVLPTVHPRTANILKAGATLDTTGGWRGLTTAVTGVENDFAAATFATFGDRLVKELPSHMEAAAEFGTLEQAALGAAAVELAKFQTALDDGILAGKKMLDAGADLERLIAGEVLDSPGDLIDGLMAFSKATEELSHPEMLLSTPMMSVSRIEVDAKGRPRVEFDVLDWQAVPVNQLTRDAAANRLKQLFDLNARQMAPLMADQLVRYFDVEVPKIFADVAEATGRSVDEVMESSKDWYKAARVNAADAAEELGTSPEVVVAVTSALSPGREWSQNVMLAEQAIRAIRRAQAMTVTDIPKYVNEALPVLSREHVDKAVRIVIDNDPSVEFGAVKPGATQKLKTDAFNRSILDALDENDATTAARMMDLMEGKLGELPDSRRNPYTEAREELPVVVDRHAVDVALGFTSAIDEHLGKTTQGIYDSFAQAYRIAAGKVGLTPSEFQAVTWVAWREQKGYTRGFTAPTEMPKGQSWQPPKVWPPFVVDDRLLNILGEGAPQTLPVNGMVQRGTARAQKMGSLDELSPQALTPHFGKGGVRKATLQRTEDGWEVVGTPGIADKVARTLYPSHAVSNGRPVWRPKQARQVASVRHLESETVSRVRAGFDPATAGGFTDGYLIEIEAPTGGYANPHGEFVNALHQRGIRFTEERLGAHQQNTVFRTLDDGSLVATPEEAGLTLAEFHKLPKTVSPRPGEAMRLKFDSLEDFRNAVKAMESPADPTEFPPNLAEVGAYNYVKARGGDYQGVRHDLQTNDNIGLSIADAYDELPEVDASPATKASYTALIAETEDQFRYLTEELGIRIEFVNRPPDGGIYATAEDMMRDVRENKRLKVDKTSDEEFHPYLTHDQNDKFRAVHDFFGHSALTNDFSRHGEEIAWVHHAQMFSKEAVPAMTSETRGQNSWLNYSRTNQARKAKGLEGANFPDQKSALLPEEFFARAGVYDPKRTAVVAARAAGEAPSPTIADEIYGRLSDRRVYAPDGTDVPGEFATLYEHHRFDGVSHHVELRPDGDPMTGDTVRVFVPRHAEFDFADNAVPAERTPLLRTEGGPPTWANEILIEAEGNLRFHGRSNNIFNVQVGSEATRTGTLDMSGNAPVWRPNDESLSPGRVKATRTNQHNVTIEQAPDPSGEFDLFLFQDAEALLRRTGWTGTIKYGAAS